MEIRKVFIRKDGVKLVVIPKKSNINAGDYVKIQKINIKEEEWQKK